MQGIMFGRRGRQLMIWIKKKKIVDWTNFESRNNIDKLKDYMVMSGPKCSQVLK